MMKKYFVAMIILGSIIAFLLYSIMNKQEFQQNTVESQIAFSLKEDLNKKDSESLMIRVLIKTTGFKDEYHKKVELSAESGLVIEDEDGETEVDSNQRVVFGAGEKIKTITAKKEGDKVIIHSVERGYGTPAYRGTIMLYPSDKGVAVINELQLEEYLYAVVPSEMPASYELEALKAQAICARCYAYNQMQTMAYPEFETHVDDSVSYQVYNNSKEQDVSTMAVKDTDGQKLWYGDQVAMTYFYSTSGGESTSVEAWGTKLIDENNYLKGVAISDDSGDDYEEGLAWYRWTAEIPKKIMENLIEKNCCKEIGELKGIEVTKKGAGGVVLEIQVFGTKETITVQTENKVREALGGDGYKIKKQDGTVINSMKLLPSAFFSIEKSGDYFIIRGGGYGHGIGMSQNGANELAKTGKNYKEILEFFYPGTKVE